MAKIEFTPYYFIIYRFETLTNPPVLEGPFNDYPFIKHCARYTLFRLDNLDDIKVLESGRKSTMIGIKVYAETNKA
jgi:hypothetical protein